MAAVQDYRVEERARQKRCRDRRAAQASGEPDAERDVGGGDASGHASGSPAADVDAGGGSREPAAAASEADSGPVDQAHGHGGHAPGARRRHAPASLPNQAELQRKLAHIVDGALAMSRATLEREIPMLVRSCWPQDWQTGPPPPPRSRAGLIP